jgi:hypothetical protein
VAALPASSGRYVDHSHPPRPCSLPLTGRLVEELRCGVEPSSDPHELKEAQLVRLHQLLHEARFTDPKGDHLSPAGGGL